ncbi:putative papain-like cysteine peptidase superfamily [Helianthus anomalus]
MCSIQGLMDDITMTKAMLDKKLDEALSKYPRNEKVVELVRNFDKLFKSEHKMVELLVRVHTVDGKDKDNMDDKRDTMEGDAAKGVVKGQSHKKKNVNDSIPSFMLLSQSPQSSPDTEIESNVNHIFETQHGLSTRAFLINTLEEGKWISQNVIDFWAALLNYTEKKENPVGKRRFWCYKTTIVVERDNELLKLRDFNIIIIPMIAKKHIYLTCFDLDNATVEVVNNMYNSLGFYKMTSGMNFRYLGSSCKVVYVGHPMASRMVNTTATRKKLEWATTDNFNDCGVFAMRHMEMYKGSAVSFDCGFSTNKDTQKMQLKNLWMKIATKLLSEANVYKGTVMELAKETVHGLKDERVQNMLKKEVLDQDKCWNMLRKWKMDQKVWVDT